VEPQATLERAERGVELDAETAVDLDGTAVIDPGNPEDDLSLRLAQSVDHSRVDVLRVLAENRTQALKHFENGLVELGFTRISACYLLIDLADVFV
jgi:hypothetical protein